MATEVSSVQRDMQPYSNIGVVFATFPNGNYVRGTCAIVGVNDILTATHVIYDPDAGGWATGFEFYFGADYNTLSGRFDDPGYEVSFGRWRAIAWPEQSFTDSNNDTMLLSEAQYDIALIGLDIPIGNTLGWLGLNPNANGTQTVTAVGYPAGSPGMMQEVVTVTANNRYGTYDSPFTVMGPGSSGGPILLDNYVIGVKSTGTWWADLGDLVWDRLVAAMAENNELIGQSVNRSPTLQSAIADSTFMEGVFKSYTLPASAFTDPDGEPLTWSAQQTNGAPLPSWLRFDAFTRTFSGTAPASGPDIAIRVTVVDGRGASASDDFVLFTANSSGGLTGTSGPDTLGGTPGNDVIDALDGDDVINASGGSDRVIGGSGNDTMVYQLARSVLLLSRDSSGTVTVADKFGAMDTLTNVEVLQFSDVKFATSSLPYAPSVTNPPSSASNSVYRFYNARDQAYFYTSSVAERDMIIRESTDPSFNPANGLWPYFYQGSTFQQAADAPGSVPVFRFYNTKTGHHFFTVSAIERDLIQREATDPSFGQPGLWPFVYEGEGFRAFADANHRDATPVYRFYSPSLDRHFFTGNAQEAQEMRLTGLWTDEGVGLWEVSINAQPNRAPAVSLPLADQNWIEGQLVSYQFPENSFNDADGDLLTYAASTPAGTGLPSWLTFAPATRTFSGTAPVGATDLVVRVTANDGRGGTVSDDFSIVTPARQGFGDYPASTATTGVVAVGGSVSSDIGFAGDIDWFRVSLTGGRSYTIDLRKSAGGSKNSLDPFLQGIYDSRGKSIAKTSNDDIGKNDRNSRVIFTPASSGDYFIAAGASFSTTGGYTLSVSSPSTSETLEFRPSSLDDTETDEGRISTDLLVASGSDRIWSETWFGADADGRWVEVWNQWYLQAHAGWELP